MVSDEVMAEVMETAKTFDSFSCSEQVRLVREVLTDAIDSGEWQGVEAALIPLALIENRVKKMEIEV